MCLDCGCGKPNDDHGDTNHITMKDVEKAAKATLVGDVFDDAATGQGLLNYFLRAVNCGAIKEDEAVQLSGLTLQELRSGSFVKILKSRQQL